MALSTYLANKLIDHVHGKASYTAPTAYIALWVGNPTAAGSGGAETTYTGYARVATSAATWASASAQANSNAAAITFGTKTAGADPTVTYWASWDASTAGNMLEFGVLTSSLLITNGTQPYFPIGALTDAST